MPTNQAMQVFYGTLPLLIGIRLSEQMLLNDILERLRTMEERAKKL
jgi:hypothetical protein